MELLAPAGNYLNFRTALEAGADAVYLGAPGLNARNLSRDPTLPEIGGMIEETHTAGKRIYIALNSLVKEQDLKLLLETLVYLECLPPDGLIIQDLGTLKVVRDHFPALPLHASTLLTVHNSAGMRMLSSLGFSRIVAARELTLKELGSLAASVDSAELEVFVHGAMCFSYSGLCLFSSYLGGKSGLRGRCVQPCRRKYRLGTGKSRGRSGSAGYYFSMNDLNGLDQIPKLMELGVASVKLEGRLRSAAYVRQVVRAYRQVIDAGVDPEPRLLADASAMLDEALGRKTSTGFFLGPRPKQAIASHHSGNVGGFLGRVEQLVQHDSRSFIRVRLKQACGVGDRLRLDGEGSGKRRSFRLTRLLGADSFELVRGEAGSVVLIELPDQFETAGSRGKLDLFLVEVNDQGRESAVGTVAPQVLSADQQRLMRRRLGRLVEMIAGAPTQSTPTADASRRGKRSEAATELWLRLDSAKPLLSRQAPPIAADRYLIEINRANLTQTGHLKRYLGRNLRKIIWALPPILHESSLSWLSRELKVLISSGFRTFQVAQLSQLELFGTQRVMIYGDYTLNLLNSQAVAFGGDLGLAGVQLSIESDRDTLSRVLRTCRERLPGRRAQLGLTVYGAPPLFISRLAAAELPQGKLLVSPKNELFQIEKREGYSLTRPKRPFSLLPFRRELEQSGVAYLIIDLRGMKTTRQELLDLKSRLEGSGKVAKLPTFNYRGRLE